MFTIKIKAREKSWYEATETLAETWDIAYKILKLALGVDPNHRIVILKGRDLVYEG